MSRPVETDELIGLIADRFLRLEQSQNPPREAVDAALVVKDGPLNHGVGTVHNQLAGIANGFVDEMVRGMTDTGSILRQVLDEYANIDQVSADGIGKLLARPPGAAGEAGPEGGR